MSRRSRKRRLQLPGTTKAGETLAAAYKAIDAASEAVRQYSRMSRTIAKKSRAGRGRHEGAKSAASRAVQQARDAADRAVNVISRINSEQRRKPIPKPTYKNVLPAVTETEAATFYESRDWKRLRYQIIRRAKGLCEACGRSPAPGLYLNVDHIKPLRFFWALRLDACNLQCLCSDCNAGKGNWDQTDWRRQAHP